MVWPVYCTLFRLLAVTEDDTINELDGVYSIVANMKKLGREYMRKNRDDFRPTFQHKFMTLLTPTLKKCTFLGEYQDNELSELKGEIEQYMSEKYPSNVEESNVVDSPPVHHISSQPDFLQQFMTFDSPHEIVQGTELTRYLQHKISSDIDCKTWWVENESLYPNLFKMFLKLSCVPATTGPSERTFSRAGNILTDKRSITLPDNVNDLIVAKNLM